MIAQPRIACRIGGEPCALNPCRGLSSEGSCDAALPPRPPKFINATRRGACRPGGRAGAGRRAQTAPAAAQTTGAAGPDPDLIVVNAKVYTMDARAPRAEAFAVSGGRFTAVGSTSDIKGLAGQEHADLRRQGHDGGARLHRLPQPRGRGSAAERGAGRQPLRGRVRQHPQHHRQAPRAGAADAGRARGSKATSSTTPS